MDKYMNKKETYGELEKTIVNLCSFRYRTHYDYQDILQEAKLAVWEALDKYDPQHPRANLPAFVRKVSINAANCWLQRKSKSPYIPYAERMKEKNEAGVEFSYEDKHRINNYGNIHHIASLDTPVSFSDGESNEFLVDIVPDKKVTKDKTLEDAIAELEITEQLVLVLHDLEGRSLQEVSIIDGREVSSLHIHRRRGIEKLKGIMTC